MDLQYLKLDFVCSIGWRTIGMFLFKFTHRVFMRQKAKSQGIT